MSALAWWVLAVTPALTEFLGGEDEGREELVREHYSRQDVRNEVVRFSRGRWLALAGRRWIRHLGRAPLIVDSLRLPGTLLATGTRAIYATTSIYRRLKRREDPYDDGNVVAVTPYLDIDNDLEQWRSTIEAARAAVEELESLGVVKSVYILWSGRGAHVRIHELSLSKEMRDLDHAWALAEYVRMRIEAKVAEIRGRYEALGMKVENQLKPRSLFTVPLSLHRRIDRVAVCLKPEELDEFDPSWTEPGGFVHDANWDEHEVGEADEAARRAMEVVGGYPVPRSRYRRREPPVDEMVRRWDEVR